MSTHLEFDPATKSPSIHFQRKDEGFSEETLQNTPLSKEQKDLLRTIPSLSGRTIRSIEDVIYELIFCMTEDLRCIHGQDRTSRRTELNDRDKVFDDMAANHQSIAWKHSIKFVSSLGGCIAAGFDPNSITGRILSSAASAGIQGGDFSISFNQSTQNRLQKTLEEVQELLRLGGNEDQQLMQNLRMIQQALDAAYQSATRARFSPQQ